MPINQTDNDKIIIFAETNYRNQRVRFGIKKDDRRRHMYLIGKTGMGKSNVLKNMIIQDIKNGEGVAVVDPHGDTAEELLEFIPQSRVNDVIYFNPADVDYPIAFNVMEWKTREQKHLIASGLIGIFKKLWADSWGPRLEYLLRNSILALLDYPGSTLLGVTRILVDKTYRKKVISKIKDPVVRAFWIDEYAKYSNQFQVEAISPIQNKVGQFLSIPMIRNIIGQVKSTIDMREIMDNKKIIIMNLSKGRIGEDASALLGAMMITKVQLAAMSRVDIPEETRQDFYLYVDEFQNFATESFANILSEARKYRLNLIIAHQYIEQLDELVQAAVFGNVGTIMCFRVGAGDSEFLAKEFTPYFEEDDLVNLTKYDVYMKLMIDGVASSPFSATTLPPLTFVRENNQDKIIKVSRERYAKSCESVEDKIARWSGLQTDEPDTDEEIQYPEKNINYREGKFKETLPKPNISKNNPRPEKIKDTNPPRKNTYTATCYECGDSVEINFKPDGIRPVYCKKCFQEIRQGVIHPEEKKELVKVSVPQPEPEISLSEALKKDPHPFDYKHKRNTLLTEKNNNQRNLHPGEVVKF